VEEKIGGRKMAFFLLGKYRYEILMCVSAAILAVDCVYCVPPVKSQ
jgi:hypothetical protein